MYVYVYIYIYKSVPLICILRVRKYNNSFFHVEYFSFCFFLPEPFYNFQISAPISLIRKDSQACNFIQIHILLRHLFRYLFFECGLLEPDIFSSCFSEKLKVSLSFFFILNFEFRPIHFWGKYFH